MGGSWWQKSSSLVVMTLQGSVHQKVQSRKDFNSQMSEISIDASSPEGTYLEHGMWVPFAEVI
eukprot:889587-Pelagomonas_calceolata.AAC.2